MKKYWTIPMLTVLFAACQESLDERCERETRAYTERNCPAKMDEHTTLDSLTFEKATRTLHYYYRLTGTADRDSLMDSDAAADILRQELKNTTGLKLYKDNHYRFAYTYRSDRNPGKVLLEVVLTDKDY